jgi:hypothetical protein
MYVAGGTFMADFIVPREDGKSVVLFHQASGRENTAGSGNARSTSWNNPQNTNLWIGPKLGVSDQRTRTTWNFFQHLNNTTHTR